MSETLPAIAPHYDDAAAWQRGLERLQAQRAEVRAGMQAALGQARPGAWLLAMQRWLQQRGWRLSPSGGGVPEPQRFAQLAPLDEWVRRALQERASSHRARRARFLPLETLERHALRIAIKRQRYAAEFFQGLFASRRQQPYLDCLRAAQDSLGRSNDARVAWQLLTDAQVEADPMIEFVRGWLAAIQANDTATESVRHLQNFIKLRPYW